MNLSSVMPTLNGPADTSLTAASEGVDSTSVGLVAYRPGMPTASPPPARNPHGWRLGRIGGVDLILGRSWPIIIVLLAVMWMPRSGFGRVNWGAFAAAVLGSALVLLVSVLIHETAHALAARASGTPVDRVVADVWGGHTVYDSSRETPKSEALIALAGPVANLALAAVAYPLYRGTEGQDGVLPMALQLLFFVNVFVAAFNLLPGLPLDGGHLVSGLVWQATGSRSRGRVVAGWAGRIISIAVLIWLVAWPLMQGEQLNTTAIVWAALIVFFLWSGAGAAITSGKILEVTEIPLGTLLSPAVALPLTSTSGRARAAAFEVATGIPAGAARATGPLFIVATDPAGRPVGLVTEAITAADQRSGGPMVGDDVPIASVTQVMSPGWVQIGDPTQPCGPLVQLMAREERPLLLIVDSAGQILGVLEAERINAALAVSGRRGGHA